MLARGIRAAGCSLTRKSCYGFLSLLNHFGSGVSTTNEFVKCQLQDKIYKIVIDRPSKKNALNEKMYDTIVQGMQESIKSDSVLTVLTGTKDFYSSGNDFSSALVAPAAQQSEAIIGVSHVDAFVEAFIEHPKPLVALVNGPAFGIAVTTLALCDLVYSVDTATFRTPFTALGIVAEGCSSYTFSYLMGFNKAAELLLLGRTVTAKEAYERNLITDIFPPDKFEQEVWARLKQFADLPPQSLMLAKQLLRSHSKKMLHETNKAEQKVLRERVKSEECRQGVMAAFRKTKK